MMTSDNKNLIRGLSATSMFILVLITFAQTYDPGRRVNVVLVGLADRWSDFGSIGDGPSVRDFLALIRDRYGKKPSASEFIKLRFLYFPQDRSDPKDIAKKGSAEQEFFARRAQWCDETFASLKASGDVSAHDPDLRPSRFLKLSGDEIKLPQPKNLLPCYEVRWPSQK